MSNISATSYGLATFVWRLCILGMPLDAIYDDWAARSYYIVCPLDTFYLCGINLLFDKAFLSNKFCCITSVCT